MIVYVKRRCCWWVLCTQMRKGKEWKNHEGEEEKDDKREKYGDKEDKIETTLRSSGGQLRGSSSPLSPSLAPAWSLQGSPGSWGKTSRLPVTPEPNAGLFTLAWLPDSFTDVTYRHTGTLSQREKGSRSTGREEKRKAREMGNGGVGRMSDEDRRRGEEEWAWDYGNENRRKESERCEGKRVLVYCDL